MLFNWCLGLGIFVPLGDCVEKAVATYSDILGWIIPWTEEPGRLRTMGLQGVRHNWSNLACTHCFANTFLKVDSSSSKVPFIPSMWQSLCNHQASLGLVIYCNLSPPQPGNSREQNTARLQNNKIMRNVELFFLSFIFLKNHLILKTAGNTASSWGDMKCPYISESFALFQTSPDGVWDQEGQRMSPLVWYQPLKPQKHNLQKCP